MPRKSILIGAAAAIAAVNLAFVMVATAAHDQGTPSPGGGRGAIQVAPLAPSDTANISTPDGSAGAVPGAAAGNAAPGALYPQTGPFQPGYPPFAQAGVGGDGVTAWGLAYKSVPDATTEPDATLVKSAFDDGQKRAQALAAAVGLKLGSLAAISDYAANQPNYNGCIQPLRGAPSPPGAPVPQTTAVPAPGSQTTAQPVPPCEIQHYAVAWVLVRYHLG